VKGPVYLSHYFRLVGDPMDRYDHGGVVPQGGGLNAKSGNSTSGLPGGNPEQILEQSSRQRSLIETPEEYFRALLQRELTPHEKYLLELADIALGANWTFRGDGVCIARQRSGPQLLFRFCMPLDSIHVNFAIC
jgi:hypothetical protein